MSSLGSNGEESVEVKFLFEQEIESSEDVPPDEWSSILLAESVFNIKKYKYHEGVYEPGSGEICTKYITTSGSSVLRHVYYNYPCIEDPGINEALLDPPPKIFFSDDGQEYYLDICKEMELCPIRIFYRGLLDEKIDLKYYGINPNAFQAIAKSIKFNKIVKTLDITENWMNSDACYHFGDMLSLNTTLKELILCGCRIGPRGARQLFHNLHCNAVLRLLDVSRNQLEDEGVSYLAQAIFKGSSLTNINLSSNGLTPKCIRSLCEAFDINNKLTHLNLSWNNILSPNAVYALCLRLEQNKVFEELDLSWNSLSGARVGQAIKLLLENPNVRSLRLTNNLLVGEAVTALSSGWAHAKHLNTVDLSYNPMTPMDAFKLLNRLKNKRVKIKNLLLDNVIVKSNFIELMKDILKMDHKKGRVITHGNVIPDLKPTTADPREIVLNRAEYICKKPRKNRLDIALIIMEIYKFDQSPLNSKEFIMALKLRGVNLDEDLIDKIINAFPGPRYGKIRTVDLGLVIEYMKRKWPDRKLPPTPPPEPEPEPVAPQKKKKGKGKGKK